jgi:hypothetical protein
VAKLQHHTCPVLCLAHTGFTGESAQSVAKAAAAEQGDSGSDSVLVLSGATDGSVAVWSLPLQETCAAEESDQRPFLAFAGVHRSGVNAISVASLCQGTGILPRP